MFFMLLAIYLLIIIIELPPLIKGRMYREIGVFAVFYLLGVYLSLVQFYSLPFFNPFIHFIEHLAGN